MSRVFVLKQLRALKRKKATGLDNLPSALLKDCADAIAGPLSHLINLSLKTGTVPLIWKKARITPLHKSGSTTTPENYRPISVLPILSKILEKSVHEQFYNFLEKENLISNRQFGYRKKRSTELASTILLDDTRRAVGKGSLVGVLFLDLSQAFDTVSRAILGNVRVVQKLFVS